MEEGAGPLDELISFLSADKVAVRLGAVQAVSGLAATPDGRALLRESKAAGALRRLVGDRDDISRAAVTAMVNACSDGELAEQMLRAGAISAVMEALREVNCAYRRQALMLLANLTQSEVGCAQVLQRGAALQGLHFRRLVSQLCQANAGGGATTSAHSLKTDVPGGGDDDDELAYAATVIHNVTQLPEARRMLLEPERGMLPPLLKLLRSPSKVRRRGIAGALRNLCAETDASDVAYLTSPGIDVVTALLYPLTGSPVVYTKGEREGMHEQLHSFPNGRKERERDPQTRLLLLDALALLAVTRVGRDVLRRARAYPVVRAFHHYVDSERDRINDVDDIEGAAEAENIAAVIDRLVQQLFRDDEVSHTSEVTGRRDDEHEAPVAPGGFAGAMPNTDVDDFVLSRPGEAVSAMMLSGNVAARLARASPRAMPTLTEGAAAAFAALPAHVRERMMRHATVSLEDARSVAARIATTGSAVPGNDDEVDELSNAGPRVPDWTADDASDVHE